MAEVNPCVFLQGGSHPAENVRQMTRGIVPSAGVAAPGDLAVAQNGTPDMSVNVSAGGVFVPGTRTATQGVYFCWNDGTVNVALDPSDSTNARIDVIVARVSDKQYDANNTDTWSIEVVKGDLSGSPVEPSVPDDAWKLAAVRVNANASSITNADISGSSSSTSAVNRATALGGIKVVADTNSFPTPVKGLAVYCASNGIVYTSDGIGWTPIPGTMLAKVENSGDTGTGAPRPSFAYAGNALTFTMPYLAPGRAVELHAEVDLGVSANTLHDLVQVRIAATSGAPLKTFGTRGVVAHGVFGFQYQDDVAITTQLKNSDYAAGSAVSLKVQGAMATGNLFVYVPLLSAKVV